MTLMGEFPQELWSISAYRASEHSDVLSDILMFWTVPAHDQIMELFED
jgi:hypothetical protein